MVGLLEADRAPAAATARGLAGDGGRSDGLVALVLDVVVDDVSIAAGELVVSSGPGDDLLFRQWRSMVCHRPTTTTTRSTAAPKRQQMVVMVYNLPFI